MKKLIVIGMVMACAAMSVQAQGTVNFQNSAATLVRFGAGTPQAGVAVPVGSMRVALYWKAGIGDLTEAGLVQIGAFGSIAPLPGLFSAGVRTTGLGTANNDMATFQARAWSAAFATYEAAIASGNPANFAGKSGVFTSATGGFGAPLPNPPVNLGPIIPVFIVSQVPEPSVIALGLLGIGSVLLFRRRKQ